ncbi:MAG: hypothetical protein Q4A34_01030 [Candidatus Saccharibacteria bacterium]|nr:hypothetical protein [Candidatus Saccharibacteria bacterium]
MYPNDPFTPQPTGIDYLNQIATPPPASGFDRKTKLIMLIFGIIGVLSLGFIMYSASQTSTGPSATSVIIKLHKLQAVREKYKGKLKTSTVVTADSSLGAVLTTAIASSATVSGASKDTIANALKEPGFEVALTEKLEDAFLNTTLDAVYVREMSYQLEETVGQLDQLAQTTKDQSARSFFTKTSTDLKGIQKQLSKQP